jgi:uncharacterized protein (TIGR03086 family)
MVGMNDIAARFHRLADAFEQTLASVPADGWERPSPCAGWTARDVVGHVVEVHGMMLKPLDRTLTAAPAVTDDPMAAYRAASADVAAVVDDPALQAFEYDGYFGKTTVGATIDQFLALDLVVHRWDLASATGQRTTIDPDDIARIRRDVESFGEAARSAQVFGEPVAVGPDATDEQRLLAFLGRTPA